MAYYRNGYLYRSIRHGRRVFTEYLGKEKVAKLMIDLETDSQDEQRAARQTLQIERDRETALNVEIESVSKLIQTLTEAVLLSEGYHAHRGEWRKQRCPNK